MTMSRRMFLRSGLLPDGTSSREALGIGTGGLRQGGSLLVFGMQARLLGPRIDYQERASVLVQVDLESGRQRVTRVPMPNAHIAQPLAPGLIMCMPQNGEYAYVLDEQHHVVTFFKAPDGFDYSGHALVLPSGDMAALPLCRRVRIDNSSAGAVEVISISALKRVDMVDSWGFNPHELQYCPQRDEIVVADYGTLTKASRPLIGSFGRPAIFTCNPSTLKVHDVFDQTALSGAPTHLRISRCGKYVYFVLQQAAFVDVGAGGDHYASRLASAEVDMERALGLPPRDYILAPGDYGSPELSAPRPLVRLDLESGVSTSMLTSPRDHRKPQSVEINRATGLIVASYTGSDTLVVQEDGKELRTIDGATVGITEIRGLADIPGTSLMAVAGSERNISLVDVVAHRSIRIFGTRNFVSPHLSFAPWA